MAKIGNRRLKLRATAILLVSILGFGWWLWAGADPEVKSRLIFPDLTQSDNVTVGYALTPGDNRSHQLTLTAYDNDGNLIQGGDIKNPVKMNLFNFAQISLLAGDIFNFPAGLEVEGWIDATSTAAELKGFFLTLENGLARVDGADAILNPGTLFIIPVPPRAEVASTQIHAVNVSDGMNQASFRLVSNSGAVLQEAQRAIPPRGKVRESLQDLLPMSVTTNDFYVVVEGDRNLAVYEKVRAGDSLAGLNGIGTSNQVGELFSPQLATGPGFETTLQLTNTSGLGVAAAGAQTLDLEITARGEDGQMLATAALNPRHISLAAGELFQMDAATFFGIPTDELRSGWIQIENLDAGELMPLIGSVSFGAGQAGTFNAALPLVSEGRLINTFSHVAQGKFGPIEWFTGLAFLFTGEGTTEILITVRNGNGQVTGRGRTTLSADNRISKTVPELVPRFAAQAGGTVQVSSTKEIMAFSLFGLADLSVLAAIPTQPILDLLRVTGLARFQISVGEGIPAAPPLALSGGNPVLLNFVSNACQPGALVGRAGGIPVGKFPAEPSSLTPEGTGFTSVPVKIKSDAFKEYGDVTDGFDGEDFEDFCEFVEDALFSGDSPKIRYFGDGQLRAKVQRLAEEFFDDARVPPGGLPAGAPGSLQFTYAQSLGSRQLRGEGVVLDIPALDCSPPASVLLQGHILVPESLIGSIDIDLNFIDSENDTNSIAFVDDSVLRPASPAGLVEVPFRAAVPVGTFTPQFRITNRGLVQGPVASGTIRLAPIQVGTSPLMMDLPFPQLVAVSGTVRDSQGGELSDYRGVVFTSATSEIFSGKDVDFRVIVPIGQDFAGEIIRDLRGLRFTAGTVRFHVAQLAPESDVDLGEVRFQDPPALMTTQIEFRDTQARPLEGALITAEVLELTGAQAGIRYFPRAWRSDANGVSSIEVLPGRYRMTVSCTQCR